MLAGVRWTNKSVRQLAGDADPVSVVIERARSVVMKAMDSGWSGPPFDPIALADLVGIEVKASASVADARTVPDGDGGAVIEFNPNRAKGRLRYSLAHEIAHTLFPDFADQVRNRSARHEQVADDWQLEALCNIAAAEIVMPLGSLPDLDSGDLSIDALMGLRRKFDVSTEAMVIRAVSLVDSPCAMFCAHKVEDGVEAGNFKFDYLIPSRSWKVQEFEASVPDGSVMAECTAIGYTAKSHENLGSLPPMRIECVGVPPYPGSSFPRVVGIILPEDASEPTTSITYLRGSVLDPRKAGHKVIAVVVNNKTANWGGYGVSTAIKKKWPKAQADFRLWAETRRLGGALGDVCFSDVAPDVTVAALVAQSGYGPSASPRIRYEALNNCLRMVSDYCRTHGASLHIPRLGCGQAGGSWDVVRDLVLSTVSAAETPVTVYDPPASDRDHIVQGQLALML